MCKVSNINDYVAARKAENQAKLVKRGQGIMLRRRIEEHKKQAEVYIDVGNESGNEADRLIANGFAREEIKKAGELQRQLDALIK